MNLKHIPKLLVSVGAALALWGAGLAATPEAFAQTCPPAVNVTVLGINESSPPTAPGSGAPNIVLLGPTATGQFSATVRVRVFCTNTGNLIPNSTVQLCAFLTNPPATAGQRVFINGTQVNCSIDESTGNIIVPANASVPGLLGPVVLALPTGEGDFNITADAVPGAIDLAVRVGVQTAQITNAGTLVVPTGNSPRVAANLFEATPELGSIALFGAGVLGLAGYAARRMFGS